MVRFLIIFQKDWSLTLHYKRKNWRGKGVTYFNSPDYHSVQERSYTTIQSFNEWNALINPVVIFKVSELTHRRVSIQVCETQQDSRWGEPSRAALSSIYLVRWGHNNVDFNTITFLVLILGRNHQGTYGMVPFKTVNYNSSKYYEVVVL